MKVQILNDMYNISKRIKNIDRDYFLVYDTVRASFEVHNSAQQDTTYCLTLPYNELDERTLNYVAKTRCANIENILEEINNNNKIQESADKSSVLKELDEMSTNILKEN